MKRFRDDVYALRLAWISAFVSVAVLSARFRVSASRSLSAAMAASRYGCALYPVHPARIEPSDLLERAHDGSVVEPDPTQHALVGRGRNEAEERLVGAELDLGEHVGDLKVGEPPLLSSLQGLPAGVGRHRRGAGRPHAERLAQVDRVCLERLIRGRPELQRAEVLDARVRPPEHLEPDHADDDEQRRDRQERNQQLRAHAGRRARNEADEPVVRPHERRPPPRGARRVEHLGLRHRSTGVYARNVAGAPAESTISHVPLIFCSVWSTPATAITFPVLGSM